MHSRVSTVLLRTTVLFLGLWVVQGPATAVQGRLQPPPVAGGAADAGERLVVDASVSERTVARELARLDERLGLATFPNSSPLWPARMAAVIDYLLGSARDGDPTGGGLLRRLSIELRQLGAERVLGGPPEEPGRPPESPGGVRAERVRGVLETVRMLHEELDRDNGKRPPESRLSGGIAPGGDGTALTVRPGVDEGTDFAPDPGAGVSGVLTDAATAGPLPGFIHVFEGTGGLLTSVFTGPDGVYELTGLPPGTYHLLAEASGFRSELWDDVPCERTCSPTLATPLTLGARGDLTEIDLALDGEASIEGSVTEEGSGAPVVGEPVSLFQSDGTLLDWVFTADDGSYRFENVSAGTYFVRTATATHRNELYDDLPCEPTCTVTTGTGVETVADSATTGIDFVLVPLGRVSGTIREAGSWSPLGDVRITAYDTDGFRASGTMTAADGTYTIEKLRTGTYFIRTDSTTHQNELYDKVPCDPPFCDPTTGTAVMTTDGSTTAGIDFTLRRRGSIAGRITHTMSGSPVSGAGVFVINSTLDFTRTAVASSDGTYEVERLPAGHYYLRTVDFGYRNELYPDIPCNDGCDITTGTLVPVQPDTTTSGIDLALDRLAFIEGRVTAADTGAPLETGIKILELNGNNPASGTALGGDFRIEGLSPGTYLVQASTDFSASEYQSELFDDVPCKPSCDLSLGTPLSVDLNGGVVGVHLALLPCPARTYEDLVGIPLSFPWALEACERITATGVTISPSGDVTFRSGWSIVLGDGFRVEEGARFRAVIEPAWSDD